MLVHSASCLQSHLCASSRVSSCCLKRTHVACTPCCAVLCCAAALTTVTIAPAGGVGAPRASCPPRALDPATNQAAVMRLWLRPRALRRITSLSLAGVAIGALGPELMCLTSLSHLDLSGCALTHLPVGLSPWGGCVAALHLRDNALRTLPQEVRTGARVVVACSCVFVAAAFPLLLCCCLGPLVLFVTCPFGPTSLCP